MFAGAQELDFQGMVTPTYIPRINGAVLKKTLTNKIFQFATKCIIQYFRIHFIQNRVEIVLLSQFHKCRIRLSKYHGRKVRVPGKILSRVFFQFNYFAFIRTRFSTINVYFLTMIQLF